MCLITSKKLQSTQLLKKPQELQLQPKIDRNNIKKYSKFLFIILITDSFMFRQNLSIYFTKKVYIFFRDK